MKKIAIALLLVVGIQNTVSGAQQRNVRPSNTYYGTGALDAIGFKDEQGNTAFGNLALKRLVGDSGNTAVGSGALSDLRTGNTNVAIGLNAGDALKKGSANIYINAGAEAQEENRVIRIGYQSTSCYIKGIFKAEPGKGSRIVVIDEAGKLATIEVSADELASLIKAKK